MAADKTYDSKPTRHHWFHSKATPYPRRNSLGSERIAPPFTLPSHADIKCTLRENDLLIKADMAHGFMQIHVQSREQAYLGVCPPMRKEYYCFTRLAFGLRSAAFAFCTVTPHINQSLRRQNIIALVYMDDWLFRHQSHLGVEENYRQFEALCSDSPLELNSAKNEDPCACLAFTGLEIDTVNCRLSLPEAKRCKYRNALASVESALDSELEKTIGYLCHIAGIHKKDGQPTNRFGNTCIRTRQPNVISGKRHWQHSPGGIYN